MINLFESVTRSFAIQDHETTDVGSRHIVEAGSLGENLLTEGLDLLALPTDTRLMIGGTVARITGLRSPCRQIAH